MRVFILDTNYLGFMADFRAKTPNLGEMSYEQTWQILMAECFGTSDFYSYNLAKLGIEAREFIANDFELQTLWAKENGVSIPHDKVTFRLGRRKKVIPWLRREISQKWVETVLKAQIETFSPDVIYVQDINWISSGFLRSMRPKVRLIAGQIACPLHQRDLSPYDVIFTSFPHFVERFKKLGVQSRYLPIAFETRVLDKLGPVLKPVHNVAFAGGISGAHSKRIEWLEQLNAHIPLDLWGYGVESLPAGSSLSSRHHGTAWGLEIYRALQSAKISLNFHIDVAENFANNMRLFEATGVGSLLLTDQKDNLNQLFDVGTEIMAYENVQDAAQKIKFLLENETQRAEIAKNGQTRTLRDHSYQRRMEELAGHLGELLR